MSELAKLCEQLENGEVPDSLCYTQQKQESIDWSKLLYNNYYRSFEFQASRFPPGFQSIPGFAQVIQHMADNAKSPLEVYEERNAIHRVVSDTSSEQRCEDNPDKQQ